MPGRPRLADITDSGDRLAALQALRQAVAAEIDARPPARDLAALARQMTLITAEIDRIAPAKEGSTVDDLAKRRADRRSDATG